MNVRGRRVTIAVAVAAAGIIVWSGLALQEKAQERWHLWKLESGDEAEREAAAEWLGKMKSTRAIPPLVEILRRAPKTGSSFFSYFLPDGPRVVPKTGPSIFWHVHPDGPGVVTKVMNGGHRSHYSFEALVRIGRAAAPALIRLLEHEERNRAVGAAALREIYGDDEEWRATLRAVEEKALGEVPWAFVRPVAGR